jgi:glycosyltransferase involved in cell wall biosynthesis
MKILLWSQYFYPENFHINSVAKALCEKNMELTILTGKPNYPEGKIVDGYKRCGIQYESFQEATVIRVPLIPRGKGSAIRLFMNYSSFILSGYWIAPFVLRRKSFDIIFVYGLSPILQALPAIFIAKLKRVPLVLWVQDLWPESLRATGFIKNEFLLSIVRYFVRFIYNKADIILIQSEGFRESVESLVKNKEKIKFFPNSSTVSEQPLSHYNERNEIALDIKQHFSIVFTGNLGKAQSCETILEAAELLKGNDKIYFYLVGYGSQYQWIEETIKNKMLKNVILTGRLPLERMPKILEAASVLLVSLTDDPVLSATIPSKVQSYLAAGKPIIASLNGMAAELINDAKAGVVASARDAKALADAINKIYYMSEDERLRFGENGLAYFNSHFLLSKNIENLIDFFKKTLSI